MSIERARISPGMLTALLTSFYSTMIGFHLGTMAEVAQRDAWLSAIVAMGIGFVVLLLSSAAAPRDPTVPMTVWIEKSLGPLLGRIVNLSLLLYFLIVLGVVLQHIMTTVRIAILPDTPDVAILALFGVPIALAARLGIEVLGRVTLFFLVLITFAFVVTGAALVTAVDLYRLSPMLGEGIGSIILGAVAPGAIFSQIAIVWWLQPYVQDRKSVLKSSALALLIATSFTLVMVVFAEGFFGFREVQRMLLPALRLVRSIQLGDVTERLDVWLVGTWTLGAFIHASLFAYLASQQFAKVAGARQFRSFVVPIAILGGIVALAISPNVPSFANFIALGGFSPFAYVHTVGVPLLLIAARGLRALGGRTPSTESERT